MPMGSISADDKSAHFTKTPAIDSLKSSEKRVIMISEKISDSHILRQSQRTKYPPIEQSSPEPDLTNRQRSSIEEADLVQETRFSMPLSTQLQQDQAADINVDSQDEVHLEQGPQSG